MRMDFEKLFEKFLNLGFSKKDKRRRVLTSLAGFHVEQKEQGQVVQGHPFACRQGEVLGRTGR